MSNVSELTRASWQLSTFPEWGTWLNEEIAAETVAPNTFAMWWLGCTGIWVKSEGSANLCIDLWCGSGKRARRICPARPSSDAKACAALKVESNAGWNSKRQIESWVVLD